jgi:hypothetical protein
MPTYSYKAVDADGKEVRGSLDAESVEAATISLQQLKLEQIVVTEAMRLRKGPAPKSAKQTENASAPTSFAFEGTAEDGSVRRGTIQAESKRHAFDRLRREQKLNLHMLSPVGVTPQYKDQDLLRWQKTTESERDEQPVRVSAATKPVERLETEKEAVVAFRDIEKQIDQAASPTTAIAPKTTNAKYVPLLDTVRLYAGWLLAWYIIFVAAGYYAFQRELPVEIPFVEGFFFSPLIFRFVTAMFLFLSLSSLHKLIHGKTLAAAAFTIVGIGAFATLLSISAF